MKKNKIKYNDTVPMCEIITWNLYEDVTLYIEVKDNMLL
jgi:hypothetical protein